MADIVVVSDSQSQDGWKRPESVPFPKRWREFTGRKVIDGGNRSYWIQDITEDVYEEIMEYMGGPVMHEEPLAFYLDVPNDKEFVPELRPLWKMGMDERLGLACYTMIDGKPKLVGYNALVLFNKTEPDLETRSSTWAIMHEILEYVTNIKDPYEIFGVDHFLGAMGLFVVPEFRGEGIALNLLQTREDLCKEFGFKVTITIFSSIASQTLAKKAGFEDLVSVDYVELGKVKETFRMPGIEEHTKSIKYMYKEYKT